MEKRTTSVAAAATGDWNSLSGFLEYKPGGALGRLMFRRRLWFVLDVAGYHLNGYKTAVPETLKTVVTTNCSSKNKPTISIQLQSAGIYSNPNEKHQFTIAFSEDEHHFTADNHESCMIWMSALQALRNRCCRQISDQQPLTLAASTATVLQQASYSSAMYQSETELSAEEKQFNKMADVRQSLLFGFSADVQHPSMFRQISSSASQRSAAYSYWFDKYQHQRHLQETFRNKGISLDSGLAFYQKQGHPFEDLCFGWESGDDVFSSAGGPPDAEDTNIESGIKKAFSEDILPSNSDNFSPFYRAAVFNKTVSQSDTLGSSDSLLGNSCGPTNDKDKGFSTGHRNDLASQVIELEQQLLHSKCELARLINKETNFKEIIDKRDAIIREMDTKITQLKRDHKDKKHQAEGQIRELESQIQFLGREIKHLTQLRHRDHQQMLEQRRENSELKSVIETWKDDYVYLLQSCIMVPTGDVVDGCQMKLFGGNTHRYRVQELTAEARQANPTLPEYSWVVNDMAHVDQYGFRHQFGTDENLVLHYLCQQLHLHYSALRSTYQSNIERWTQLLNTPCSQLHIPITNKHELKYLCRQGIPVAFRAEVWKRLIHAQVADVKDTKGDHYYRHLMMRSHDSPVADCYRKQIGLDLMRTMPNNINFNTADAEGPTAAADSGLSRAQPSHMAVAVAVKAATHFHCLSQIRRLREVLQAFSMHNPDIGYCQGLNFITAVFLLFLNPEDAFWGLIAITEKYFTSNYFDKSLTGARADQEVLKELICEKLPELYNHLNSVDIELSTVTLNWFLPIFFDAVPFQTLLRIWDCFLVEGPKVLFRFSMAFIRQHQDTLIGQPDTISIMRFLKSSTRMFFDADGLVKVSFEGLRPFPKRCDIQRKQLKSVEMLQNRQKKYHDNLAGSVLPTLQQMAPQYECAIVGNDGVVWLFLGTQNEGFVSRLDCSDGLARQLDIKFDSLVLSAFIVDKILLVATLSKHLYAYNVVDRQELWSISLTDSAVCLTQAASDNGFIFVGLINGSILVLEDVKSGKDPSEQMFYRFVGQAPISSMLAVGSSLWVACGGAVHVINSLSLDISTRLTPVSVSTCSVEESTIQTLTMSSDRLSVWVAIRGSGVLELWDINNYTCLALFDCVAGHCIGLGMENDLTTSHLRITCILSAFSCLWVGTADGTLYIYDITVPTTDTTPQPPVKEVSIGNTSSTSSYLLRKNMTRRRDSHHTSTSDLPVAVSRSSGVNGYDSSKVGLSHHSSVSDLYVTKGADVKERRPSGLKTVNRKVSSSSTSLAESASRTQTRNASELKKLVGDRRRPSDICPTIDRSRSMSGTKTERSTAEQVAIMKRRLIARSQESIAFSRNLNLSKEFSSVAMRRPGKSIENLSEGLRGSENNIADSVQKQKPPRSRHESTTRLSFSEDVNNVVGDVLSNGGVQHVMVSMVCNRINVQLQAKIKVSESPVRYLLDASWSGITDPLVVSLSGCYGDDEAILMWKRCSGALQWLNEPVWEVCPETHYPRRRSSYKLYQKSTHCLQRCHSASVDTSTIF